MANGRKQSTRLGAETQKALVEVEYDGERVVSNLRSWLLLVEQSSLSGRSNLSSLKS